jgi:Sec7-like guanine-nucleotide exchange factor
MNLVFICQQVFASRYSECNPEVVSQFRGGTDTIFLLSFATVLLNTDLHHRCVSPRTRMSVDDFIHNLRGWIFKYRAFTVT